MRTTTSFSLIGLGLLVATNLFATPCAGPEDSPIAGRHDIQNRTGDFYYQASTLNTCSVNATAKNAVVLNLTTEVETAVSSDDATQLAGRYYIRNRTRDFYRRATSSSRRHIG